MGLFAYNRQQVSRASLGNSNTDEHTARRPIPPARTISSATTLSLSDRSSLDSFAVDYTPPPPPVARLSNKMDQILRSRREKDKDKEKEKDGHAQKRLSLTMRPASRSKDRKSAGSPALTPKTSGKLSVIIESPPLVMHGSIESSSGALLSGRLKLLVTDPSGQITVTSLIMKLSARIAVKKPVAKDCPDCTNRIDLLKEWKFLSESKSFHAPPMENEFPFSFLLPGHLPATTTGSLGQIEYVLTAEGKTTMGESIRFSQSLPVWRALAQDVDRNSMRVFPPTTLTGRATLPALIHPIGTFPVHMTLSGIVEKHEETQNRWRLRKIMWRIEEHQIMKSPPCPKHQHKVGEGKGVQHEETRTVGSGEVKGGWKTDFDTAGGEIEMEFEAALNPTKKALCDVEAQFGLTITHNLVTELIIAEEFCANRTTHIITPTGAARVLRMQFGLNVTTRAGMGISWDEEAPPVYEDVPESPPGYRYGDRPGDNECTITDYTGEIEYEELERLHTENPDDPPMYRERAPTIHETTDGESSRHPLMRTEEDHVASAEAIHRRRDVEEARRIGRFTVDELGAEPPQWPLNQPPSEEQAQPTLDVAEGQAGTSAT